MFVDLSVQINESTPVYPGDPKTKISPCGILAKDGYQDHYVCFGTHAGTHIDAPSHMIANGKNIDQISLEKFSGRGVYINATKGFDFNIIKKAEIKENDVVLFHTGMSDKYHMPEYYENYPAMPEEIADFLVKKKVKIVGVDMCSPDYQPFLIHHIFLPKNILIIENITNLISLSGKEFKIYAFPLKLCLDGAPVRVVAEISS
jgi:arylformamidase